METLLGGGLLTAAELSIVALINYPWAQQGRLRYLQSGSDAAHPASLQNLSYQYDAVGNISTLTDVRSGETQTYSYDALNRLTSANVTGAMGYTESYSYNPVTGNLASKAGQALSYDPAHPHAVKSLNGNSYTYDANGNQTKRTVGGVTYNLTYNVEGQLVQVDKGTVNVARFTYDGDPTRGRCRQNGKIYPWRNKHDPIH